MKFYRYEIVNYAVLDDGEFASPRIPNPCVELREYNLHSETPKGYWIGYGTEATLHSTKRWVSKTAKKRHAYPTKEEAMNNFIRRTQRRIKILGYQKLNCEFALDIAKNMQKSLVELI